MTTVKVLGWDELKQLHIAELPVEVVVEKGIAPTSLDIFDPNPAKLGDLYFTTIKQGVLVTRDRKSIRIIVPGGRIDLREIPKQWGETKYELADFSSAEFSKGLGNRNNFSTSLPDVIFDPREGTVRLRNLITNQDMFSENVPAYIGYCLENVMMNVETPQAVEKLFKLLPGVTVYGKCLRLSIFEGLPVCVVDFCGGETSKVKELTDRYPSEKRDAFHMEGVTYVHHWHSSFGEMLSVNVLSMTVPGQLVATRTALWDLAHGFTRNMGYTFRLNERLAVYEIPGLQNPVPEPLPLVFDELGNGYWKISLSSDEAVGSVVDKVAKVAKEIDGSVVVPFFEEVPLPAVLAQTYISSLVYQRGDTVFVQKSELGARLARTFGHIAMQYVDVSNSKRNVEIAIAKDGHLQERFWETLNALNPELNLLTFYKTGGARIKVEPVIRYLQAHITFREEKDSFVLNLHEVSVDLEVMVRQALIAAGANLLGYFGYGEVSGGESKPSGSQTVFGATLSSEVEKALTEFVPKAKDFQPTWKVWKVVGKGCEFPNLKIREGKPEVKKAYFVVAYPNPQPRGDGIRWDLKLLDPSSRKTVSDAGDILPEIDYGEHKLAILNGKVMFTQQPVGCFTYPGGVLYTKSYSNKVFQVRCSGLAALHNNPCVRRNEEEIEAQSGVVTATVHRLEGLDFPIYDLRPEIAKLNDSAIMVQYLGQEKIYLMEEHNCEGQAEVEAVLKIGTVAELGYEAEGVLFRRNNNGNLLTVAVSEKKVVEEASVDFKSSYAQKVKEIAFDMGVSVENLIPFLRRHEEVDVPDILLQLGIKIR